MYSILLFDTKIIQVDYCVFDLNSQTTIPIVSAAALIPEIGSLVVSVNCGVNNRI